MKKSIIFLSFIVLLVIPLYLYDVDALRQVAGKIEIDIKPGQTKTFDWGLASDNKNNPTQVEISSEKDGSEFLFFEKNITLDPLDLKYSKITVSIPDNYPGGIKLEPFLYATEFGEKGGATVINIRMLKVVTLNIAPNDDPALRVDWSTLKKSEPVTSNISEPQLDQENKSPNTMTIVQSVTPEPVAEKSENNSKGGGCLIATATYGSEMASQVQQLRELRDNHLLQTKSGQTFVQGFNDFYYSFSPTIADWERQNPIFKEAVKITITPLITSLSILNYVDMDSEYKALGFGISLILLNIGMYFVAPAIVVMRLKSVKKTI